MAKKVQGTTYLDSRLDALQLDSLWLPHTVLLHVHQCTSVAVDAPRAQSLSVLGAQVGEHAHRACTSILDKCAGDDLHRLGHSLVWPLLDTLNALGLLAQSHRDSHLGRTTTGGQARVEHNIARYTHGILQVTLNLVEDILGRSTQKNSAGLGILALGEEGEVLVANLFDLKQAALGADVGVL